MLATNKELRDKIEKLTESNEKSAGKSHNPIFDSPIPDIDRVRDGVVFLAERSQIAGIMDELRGCVADEAEPLRVMNVLGWPAAGWN